MTAAEDSARLGQDAMAHRPGRLWAHQDVAVAAVVRALGGGGRATVESACGSGKSRIAARVAAELVAAGPVLVVVPTLDLAGQMADAFTQVRKTAVVAVCCDHELLASSELDADGLVTTDPAVLAEAVRGQGGGVTVICTYQSLPILAAAHRDHLLPAWPLAVVDEAHRTAGLAGKAWAAVHDDVAIPAQRRLYMTATRKVIDGDGVVVSMDDEKIYGRVVFRLTTRQAIDRGLLADYRLLVPVVEAPVAGDEHVSVGRAAISPGMLATQLAVLRAAAEHDLHAMITFHHRVGDARAWAVTLPQTWQLADPALRPVSVSAHHVHGGQVPAVRRRILQRLGAAGEPGLRVVANARVLGEGVDVPAVDSVVFVSPRSSVIDIVQAVGRAMRTGGQTGKVATIIVPVLLAPGESPQAALEGSAFSTVWQVLRALRAHDEELEAALDAARLRLGTTSSSVDGPVLEMPGWLSLTGVPLPAGFAQAIWLQAVRMASPSWWEYYGAAQDYHRAHGDLAVTVDHQTADGLKLGQWLRNQRRGAMDLSDQQRRLLDVLGMEWGNRLDLGWNKGLAAARAFVAVHQRGLHDIPLSWHHRGVKLRVWLTAQGRLFKDGKLSAARATALNEVDPTWHLSRWDTHHRAAQAYVTQYGHLLPDADYRTPGGLDLHGWLTVQRSRRKSGEMPADQQRKLDELGMPWSYLDAKWDQALAVARSHAHTHHHLNVPASFTWEGFALGQWLHTQRRRARAGRLSGQRRALLNALDPNWERASGSSSASTPSAEGHPR